MKANQNKKPVGQVTLGHAGRLVFSLVSRPRVNLNKLNPGSHAGATVMAIRKLRRATSDEIIAEVAKQKKIETRMDVYRAVHFQLFDLRRRRVLKVVQRRRAA